MSQVLTPNKLAEATGASLAKATLYARHLDDAMAEFGIRRTLSRAHFIAQMAHESARFERLEENLNYSWHGLMRTWPSRFPNEAFAKQFHRQPERIANWVYANRMGNGMPSSGDGWKYRGRGFVMLTGRYNYARCAGYLHLDLVTEPDLLLEPENAARSAAWYWSDRGCNTPAEANDVEAVTKAVNGGLVGLDDRRYLASRVLAELAA